MMQERNVHNDTWAISNDYQMKDQFLRVLEQAALKIVSQMNYLKAPHLLFISFHFKWTINEPLWMKTSAKPKWIKKKKHLWLDIIGGKLIYLQ